MMDTLLNKKRDSVTRTTKFALVFATGLILGTGLLWLRQPAMVQEATPRFERTRCDFQLRRIKQAECGYLVVQEERNNPQSPLIRLSLAILRHPGGKPEADPIIYLEGGPGGSIMEALELVYPAFFVPMFEANRDIIVFDQRGVGASEPALECPAHMALAEELLNLEMDGRSLSPIEAKQQLTDSLTACGQTLASQYQLTAYNSAASAADVEDLRLAFGYEAVNLWGISYGTRLALTIMRDYPDSIRSVLIDSVYPPDVNLYTEFPENAARAFDVLFDSCAAEAECNAAFPELRRVFFDLVAQLNETPVRVAVTNQRTGTTYPDMVFSGDVLLGSMFRLLYNTHHLSRLPQLIYEVDSGDYTRYAQILGSQIAQENFISRGMSMAVQCQEELFFTEGGTVDAAFERVPEFAGLGAPGPRGDLLLAVCAAFHTGATDAVENQAVVSDLPTLLIAGEFDPITPPAWAQQAASTLSNSYYVELPAAGHGPTGSIDCAQQIAVAFFIDPNSRPDRSCVTDLQIRFHGIDE